MALQGRSDAGSGSTETAVAPGASDLVAPDAELAFSVGNALGLTLGNVADGEARLEPIILDALARARVRATAREVGLRGRIDSLRSECRKAQQQVDRVEADYQPMALREGTLPSEHSLAKGWLYVLLSLVLIGSDVAILGQVLVQFLGVDWTTARDNETFLQVVFTRPWKAYAKFPELFLLTVGILAQGMTLKILRDAHLARQVEPESKSAGSDFRWAVGTFVASTVVLASVAAVRATIAVGSSVAWLGKAVSVILGLMLPLIGAVFFIKGYEAINNRARLRGAARRRTEVGRRLEDLTKQLIGAEEERRAAAAEMEWCNSPEHTASVKARVRQSLASGYRSGIEALVSDGEPRLHVRLRPLALQRLLTRRSG